MKHRTLFPTGILAMTCLLIFGVPEIGADSGEEGTRERPRARHLGFATGVLETGPNNAITDVPGVLVGHFTMQEAGSLNTGITAVLPHRGNLFHEKVPAAVFVGNGFGKLLGSTQINELGEIETPILLTGTLNVFKVADGLVSYMLALPGMEAVRSINPVVGETNDGYLSDIRARPLGYEEVRQAIEAASSGEVQLGTVGAGTGTVCFGFKGGIGSSSRKLDEDQGGWTVGVLVQTNFGGPLRIGGLPDHIENVPLGEYLEESAARSTRSATSDGSLMVVVATDAPLSHRNLSRLAERALYGMARTGGYGSNGSGDYVIAFSTDESSRIRRSEDSAVLARSVLDNDAIGGLFLAAAEATEEAILDSLFAATAVEGFQGSVPALPVDKLLELVAGWSMIPAE